MTEPFSLEKLVQQPLSDFLQLNPDQRASAVRPSIPDLHFFFDAGAPLESREAPPRTRELALSLYEALSGGAGARPSTDGAPAEAAHGPAAPAGQVSSLRERIVTDALLRSEADRDQNVYLGRFFTRVLTRAEPDLIFQPASVAEAAAAFRWARDRKVPVTLRGAASAAMGGAVPNDGGLTLDLSRLDHVDLDGGVCVVGAGARLRTVHQRLAERGLALRVYPSNLGGTLAGWFATGGIGMNAFGNGRALDSVRAADLLLPAGEHVRFHDDGRLDVPDGHHRRTLRAEESAGWFESHGYRPMTLADLAGSEGVFGLLLQLAVAVEPRPEIGAFLLSFERRDQALEAEAWVAREAGQQFARPGNVKLLSGSHLHHVRRVWRDEDARAWKAQPSALGDGSTMPWARTAGPAELGAVVGPDREHAAAYLFVDFLGLDGAYAFAVALAECPGDPLVLDGESLRFSIERFRPQQTKRLGPGLLAAEILMPAEEVGRFLPRAEAMARHAGLDLDAEVYYLADGTALVIAAYLVDHRNGSFALELVLAPALLDLAMAQHRGRPYVLGRWQAAWASRRFGRDGVARLRGVKRALDPGAIVNRGVLLDFKLRGPLGALTAAGFGPGMGLLRRVYQAGALSGLVSLARAALRGVPGPARGRGEPVRVGAERASDGARHGDGAEHASERASASAEPATTPQAAAARALHCVNCGECNSVCPIFSESKIRLPQMLTHLGEALHAGETVPGSGSVLLDLCMRCGNCEEVCQAGIPHLPLYEVMQGAADRERPRDRDRHAGILSALRGSHRYTREFLKIRPGFYLKRAPASLPGVPRYLVMRSENDSGPASTCIHCGACVAVCPTHANREFEGVDPRSITTVQERCIGCGTCVEVCPANHTNGGRTLRVVEAPSRDWFLAIEDFERQPLP